VASFRWGLHGRRVGSALVRQTALEPSPNSLRARDGVGNAQLAQELAAVSCNTQIREALLILWVPATQGADDDQLPSGVPPLFFI